MSAVLLFHGGFEWASGGYLGVSVFFTLSGFLITRLMLEEHFVTGTVRVTAFYARRVRRLVPAAAVTLAAVVAIIHLGLLEPGGDRRRELVGAALQLGNWTQLTSGRSYADLFASGASPVEHFWSLAIEEQFYLLWPLAFLALARGSVTQLRWRIGALFAAFAMAAPLTAHSVSHQAAYLATPARLAEILAGAVLAVTLDLGSPSRWWRRIAVPSGAAIIVLFSIAPPDHGWAYSGGLPLFSLASAALIGGATVEGPVATLLGRRPFVWLGGISYGLYLVHWPIFLVVDARGWSLPAGAEFAIGVGLSVLTATTLAALVERPVRASRPRRATVPAGVLTMSAVAVLAWVVVPGPAPGFGDVSEAERRAVDIPDGDGDFGPLADSSGRQLRPVRMMVVGDSTGEVVGPALVQWANDNPRAAQVQMRAVAGCGFVSGGRFGTFADRKRDECDRAMQVDIPAALPTTRPDLLVISISAADTWSRTWDDGPLLRPSDPDYERRIRQGYDEFIDTAVEAGVPHVVWLRPPAVGLQRETWDLSYRDGSQKMVEDIVRAAADRHPGRVVIVDYRTWFEQQGMAHDQTIRPDGVHLTAPVALEVANEFLAPTLMEIALP